MTIHHATIKRATNEGIILTETDDGVQAHHANTNRRITHPDAKVALKLCQLEVRFGHEYDVGVDVNLNHTEARTHPRNSDEDVTLAYFDPADFDIEQVFVESLETASDKDVPIETEDTGPSGNVVPEKYKTEYKARGNAAHCGDWLAIWLDGKFEIRDPAEKKPIFDADGFTEFLVANDVDMTGKWINLPTSGQKGWAGRYRMNGRQKLEKVVAVRGTVKWQGKDVKVPKPDLAILRRKHAALVEAAEIAAEEAKAA